MEVKTLIVFTILTLLFNKSFEDRSESSNQDRLNRYIPELSGGEVLKFARKTDTLNINAILDHILLPRVVGTIQHDIVAEYIVREMENLGWDVERDRFTDTTPTFGEFEFQNIIARLNPNARSFLVLACHYDSKYVRENDFVGATDSGVPCAMMINLAHVLQAQLKTAKANNEISLLFIFFDGEEAFETWSATDSTYGARHLASKWENQISSDVGSNRITELDKIDVIVLLDLIGARDPQFYSYFPSTARLFARLCAIETLLAEMGQLVDYKRPYFINKNPGVQVEDDHVPFLRRGVPILHVIPSPFPDVWHTPSDERSAVSLDTVENLNRIFRVFVSEYLRLKPD